MSWQKVKVGKLGRVVTGKTPPTKDLDNFGSDFPFITPGDMHGTKFANTTERKLSLKGGYVIKGSRLPPGSVCVSCIGSDMGNVLFTTCDSFTNQQINSIIPSEQYCADFIYYLMKTKKSEILGIGTAGGSAVPIISKSEFCDLDVIVPNLPVQRRIAAVLGAYDDLIENNRRRIALLEKMARELYRERFVRRAGKGKTVTLEEIGIRLETGTRPKGGIKDISEGVPSVGAENVIGLGQYNFASEKLVSEEFFKAMKRGVINDRDILLYKDGAYIGRVSLFQDGFPHKRAAVNEHVFLLHSNDEDLQYFLFFTLAQEKYFKIMQCLNENAAQPGLNQGAVLGLKVVLPPKKEVLVFDSQVAPMVAEIFNLALQNRSLTRQRDRLLPRLMSGKIDVVALVKEEERHG